MAGQMQCRYRFERMARLLSRAARICVAGGLATVMGAGMFEPGAVAQGYPARPITIIVPFAAGGAADVNGRIFADAISQRLGQTVIIENVPGAGGTTGSNRGKNALNDGYTILLGHMGTQAAAVSLYSKLGYDPRNDFEPLGLISMSPILLFARKDLPPKDLPGFISYAKAQGNKLTVGHSGVGSISHITCALLASIGGFSPTFVPYRGVGPMMNDMLGGNVDFGCDLVLAVSPQINGGGLKGYAIAATERSTVIPGVPTAAECGVPAFSANAWTALFVPKGTPPEVLTKLRNAIADSLDDPKVQERLAKLGASTPKPNERGAEYLGKFVRSEIDRWSKVIKDAGITPQ